MNSLQSKRSPGGSVNYSKKRGKKQRKASGQGVPLVQPLGTFRQLSLVFPPRMPMKLKFWQANSISLAASLSGNYRWRPSAAFDIDPALGGTSMAGFAEMAGFYSTYRVAKSSIKVTVSNPSATIPVTCIVLPMNADPTNAFSTANVVASMGNPYAKARVLGLLGSPATVINSNMTTAKIFGDSEVFFDHNFTSLVTTVPANNWFWNLCLYAPAFIATAITVVVEIVVDCEFYDRIFLPA